MRRPIVAVLVSCAALTLTATPAAAHSGSGGVGASNFRTELTDVEPSVDGVRVRVLELGDRIELTNETDEDVIVYGYEDEPYLRIGPEGVFENERSAATYVNQDRQAETDIPDEVDADAEPLWRKISDGRTARWHDHRAHWMGSGDPPAARANPDEEHVIYDAWEIPVDVGGERVTMRGTLTWYPGPSSAPWYLLAAGLAAVVLVLALAVKRVRPYVLAAGAVVAVAFDVVHALGLALAPESVGPVAWRVLSTISYPTMGWGAGLASLWFLRKRRWDGVYLTAFAGISVFVIGGITNLSVLSRSQVHFRFDPVWARLGTATGLGIGGALLLASSILLLIRQRSPQVAL